MTINRIRYAGHSAVFLESPDIVIAIDPWLLGNPVCPEALATPKKLDLIILTHGHSDHAGDAVRLAKSTGAFIAATFELAMLMIEEGIAGNKVIPMNKGGSTKFNKFNISLTHAYHSNSYDTEKGPRYAGEACGVIVNDGRRSFYHAGDTALFFDMQLIAELYSPEIIFLPIGDRFTMGPKQAAHAVKYLRPKLVVPIHYKTFDALPGTAEAFKEECKAIPENKNVIIRDLEPGQSIDVI